MDLKQRDIPSSTGGARPTTMTAVVQDRYGEAAEVLRVAEVPIPVIGDRDVLVRVEAAGVDRGVWHLVGGTPRLVRLAVGLRAPRQKVPGMDVAGGVEVVGAAVTRFRVGDEVYGAGSGTFAEHARVPEASLALRPAGLTAVQAAAVPISGCTALEAVRDRARVRAGDRVLVLGASGGVGSYAVQVAAALGAEVTGTASTAKVDMVRALGVDHVVDHSTSDPLAEAGSYDVIIDTGGARSLRSLRRAMTPTGRLVIVGGETDGWLLGGLDRQLRASVLSLVVRQSLVMFVNAVRAADLEALTALVEAGSLVPAVDRTYPLAEAAAAIRDLSEGRVRGKAVVTV
ncbi:NAD(P)-dependent alcohol dehydrogenase [Actinotalea solisilvae]|uniref:NAD(P)-dependent alcohol dehydrogenase n=1 Tax=Actinotalea solisilvae TaxID=2072922 RepID=UPI0027DAE019|nr:NAD(P)-dependent alcohol dehydrogenase [Actinotalea solisilvae]